MEQLIHEMILEALTEAVAKIACVKCDEVSTAAAWKKKGGFCPKCKTSSQGVAEEVELEEAKIRYDRYVRSHGKNPRMNGSGAVMFTHKPTGDVDYKNSKEVLSTRGNKAEVSKAAKDWAKEHGHHEVYWMESVEGLDEVSNERLRKVQDRAAKRVALSIGKTVDDENTPGLKKRIPATPDEMKLANKGIKSYSAVSRAFNRKADAEKKAKDAEKAAAYRKQLDSLIAKRGK